MSNKKPDSRKFLSMTALSLTENLGSQMWHFASLYCISRRTGHRILFFSEHIELGKGLQLHKHFPNLPFEIVSINEMSDREREHYVLPVDRDVVVDSRFFQLDGNVSYNVTGLFISYRYWYPRRAEIAGLYTFDPTVVEQARTIVDRARTGGRQVVALHVRRSDYLNGVFINVTRDYYDAAFEQFDDASVTYLVFSDDLPWCRENFADKSNLLYSDDAPPIVDMAAMSLCDHNIIANSSFSFWGAFLNRNPDRRVICPAKSLKADKAIPHCNYAWYPDEFIGLDAGNV